VGPNFEKENGTALSALRAVSNVVVAGPVSTVTIPGLMTAEVVGALAAYAKVTKVGVNPSKDYDSGLHRARALSANHQVQQVAGSIRQPWLNRQRRQEFRQYFKERAELAVALAWPGIDSSWIGEFVHVANQAGARTVVLVVTHPSSSQGATQLAREVVDADLVLVGDIMDATLLSATLGSMRPVIEVHRALSLTGRSASEDRKRLTTFLPKDDEQALLSVLTAFDAIPNDWIGNYDLRLIMRYSGRDVPDRVAASFHANRVELISDDLSSAEMARIAADSSAVSVADPTLDSRVYATAVDSGVATVVLAGGMVTDVGRGYVGGLLADLDRPTSVYVAHNHALRLSELRFPSPDAWFELAARLATVVAEEPRRANESISL